MKLLLSYLQKNRVWLIFLGLCTLTFALVFFLYDLPFEAVGYAGLLCVFIGSIFFVLGLRNFTIKRRQLTDLKDRVTIDLSHFPSPQDITEGLYQELLQILFEHQIQQASQADKTRQELEDYYTLWAHQIKTPIAAMDLLLQDQPGEQSSELALELFKIEQYVEMVLHYLRIESPSADLDLRRHNLEEIVKNAVRKYAKMFIQKRIDLDLGDLNRVVLTDDKWLGFVIEQVISNALKYTSSGNISVFLEGTHEEPPFLVIADTGWGIAPWDLPRVFEKGFTGYGGRLDQRSTGIGLYLCRLIVQKLSHTILIESVVGQGTKVKIGLDSVDLKVE